MPGIMSAAAPLLVQFGAGNIGRSLLGQLFSAAGWRVAFVDIDDKVIAALNARGGYEVVIKDAILPGQPETISVRNVSGVSLRDREGVGRALAAADLLGTSVGAANLPTVCECLAAALPGRKEFPAVLLCENLHHAAAAARGHLREAVAKRGLGVDMVERVAFVEAAISKMVPATPAEVRAADPLVAWAEAYNTLYLDRDAYPGVPPVVSGVAWRRDFSAYVDRKLYGHNFAHAACAYAGFLAGRKYIWECMADAAVAAETRGCMYEVARGLAQRWGGVFTFDEIRAWSDDLLRRFGNRVLADPVARVGRDLRRKLAPGDRCIGALRLLQAAGLDYTHTARAIGAALRFLPEGEGEFLPDREVAERAAAEGPEAVLLDLCGLDPVRDGEAVARIADAYRRLPGGPRLHSV